MSDVGRAAEQVSIMIERFEQDLTKLESEVLTRIDLMKRELAASRAKLERLEFLEPE
jgi:hypothetical protein